MYIIHILFLTRTTNTYYMQKRHQGNPHTQKECFYPPPPFSKIPGSVFAVVHHVIYVNQASDRDFFHNVKRMFLFLYDKWNKLLQNINLLRYNYKKKFKKLPSMALNPLRLKKRNIQNVACTG